MKAKKHSDELAMMLRAGGRTRDKEAEAKELAEVRASLAGTTPEECGQAVFMRADRARPPAHTSAALKAMNDSKTPDEETR